MCKFLSYIVPEGPPYHANGPSKSVTRCEEHNWIMEGHFTQLPDQPSLCPIGRIEKAVEDGLAKLDAVSRT